MRKALIAGAAYFAAVFSLGFLMGVLRVLVVAPRLGEGGALLLELPVMLAASWLLCGALMTRFGVSARPGDRVVMSGTALVLLMIAEPAGAMILFGRTPGEVIASYRTVPALLGLASQVAFVLFPLFRRRP
jgi:hypothetical protein